MLVSMSVTCCLRPTHDGSVVLVLPVERVQPQRAYVLSNLYRQRESMSCFLSQPFPVVPLFFFLSQVGVRGGSGGPGVVSINGWEFGEDPLEQLYSMAQAAARNSFGTSGASGASRGFGWSPRLAAEDRRSMRSAFEALAPRVDFAARADGLLWMPLWLFVPQDSASPADKMRPVPNAFEMDAVVWKPGPFAPETDPGSGWLLTARVAALEAPNDLLRWVPRIAKVALGCCPFWCLAWLRVASLTFFF